VELLVRSSTAPAAGHPNGVATDAARP
jgi:hypothetical protein